MLNEVHTFEEILVGHGTKWWCMAGFMTYNSIGNAEFVSENDLRTKINSVYDGFKSLVFHCLPRLFVLISLCDAFK